MDWADIPIVDVSAANTPEGRASLVSTIRDAMHSVGMFYVVNHGLPQSEVCLSLALPHLILLILPFVSQNNRIRDIANAMFTEVSEDEKKIYAGQSGDPGKYSGYHLRGHMVCVATRQHGPFADDVGIEPETSRSVTAFLQQWRNSTV